MFKLLKKVFIPHKHNDFKPHLFRETGAAVIFSAVVILFVVVVSGREIISRTDLTALVLPKVLVDYTNENRAKEKYNNLAINPTLEKAAQLKANDMAEKGYFSHVSPDGKSPWYFFRQAGYEFSYIGENLAVNFSDSSEVSTAWMNSPTHKANILDGRFTETGVGVAYGTYKGVSAVFVVEFFGSPKMKPASTTVASTVVATSKPTSQKTEIAVIEPKTFIISTTTKEVLGESTSVENEGEYKNIASVAVPRGTTGSVAGTTSEKNSSFIERVIMSPNRLLSIAYLIISLIIIFGLILLAFVEEKHRHPRMMYLALGLLVVTVGLLYVYRVLLFNPLVIG